MINNVEVAAEAAAGSDERLITSKAVIRAHSEGLSTRRVEMLCELVDQMYRLGFTAGVSYLGHEVVKSIDAGSPRVGVGEEGVE